MDDETPLSNELLTPEEAAALVAASSSRAPTGLRNRALVAMMYRSGLRPGEALALLPGDVDLGAATVRVPPRKGGRPPAHRSRRHDALDGARSGSAGARSAASAPIGPSSAPSPASR